MRYEVLQSHGVQGEWRVEATNHEGDGEVYVTLFSGPDACARAEEYAAWKNTPAPTGGRVEPAGTGGVGHPVVCA